MLKVLINQFNPKAGFALLKFLPQDDVKELQELTVEAADLNPILHHPKAYLGRLHYTWLKHALEKIPQETFPFIYSILSTEQRQGIQPAARIIPLSEPVKNYFINELYSQCEDTAHLPIEYLPKNELSPLLGYNKDKLVQLGSFLGLYDLANEVRTIVNKTHLKNFYSCLTPKQFAFLKTCLQKKEIISVPKLSIDPSKQDCHRLKQILQHRGLLRLGKAISGMHPDFAWYVAHQLDMARGKIVMTSYAPQSEGKLTHYLKSQVVNLMNYLKDE